MGIAMNANMAGHDNVALAAMPLLGNSEHGEIIMWLLNRIPEVAAKMRCP
jgi:hypothetical protein